MPEETKPKILWVENDESMRRDAGVDFRKNFDITFAATYDEAVSLGCKNYDLVVLDGNLDNGRSGPEFHKVYLNNQNQAPVIYVTSLQEEQLNELKEKCGVSRAKAGYLNKVAYSYAKYKDAFNAAIEVSKNKGIAPDGV